MEPFAEPDTFAGEGAGGVTEFGRVHPWPGEDESGDAVSFAVTKRECECADCGAGRAISAPSGKKYVCQQI